MKPHGEGVPHGKHPAAKQKARRDPRDTARVVRSPERRGNLPAAQAGHPGSLARHGVPQSCGIKRIGRNTFALGRGRL